MEVIPNENSYFPIACLRSHIQCLAQPTWPRFLTNYIACHEVLWSILVARLMSLFLRNHSFCSYLTKALY